MRPLAQSDGHDAPWLIDELVPCFAAMVDEIVIGFENTVREPVVAHVLPDVLNRVEFWGFWRQGDNGDVGGNDQSRRQVPSSLIDQEHGVGTGRDGLGNFSKVQVHCLGIAGRQDQGRALAIFWADGAKDIGGSGALVPRCAGTGAALGPATGDLVLLAETRLVREPYFYLVAVDRLLARDCIQERGEVFF